MTENKYSRGKIYKLVSSQTQDVYYGSTIEDKLTNRLAGHRKGYKRWLNHKYNFSTSFEIIKFDDCKIILVENFPCNSIYELLAREQYHIENNECVNKYKAYTGFTKDEYNNQYYHDHRNEIIEQKKEYHQNHRTEIIEKQRIYNQSHRQEIKQYYEKNKEKIQERNRIKITCQCGSEIQKHVQARHNRSKKHQAWIHDQQQTGETI